MDVLLFCEFMSQWFLNKFFIVTVLSPDIVRFRQNAKRKTGLVIKRNPARLWKKLFGTMIFGLLWVRERAPKISTLTGVTTSYRARVTFS